MMGIITVPVHCSLAWVVALPSSKEKVARHVVPLNDRVAGSKLELQATLAASGTRTR
jgi:hypothetical protein